MGEKGGYKIGQDALIQQLELGVAEPVLLDVSDDTVEDLLPDWLYLNEHTWNPDRWTGALLRGLHKIRADIRSKNVVEVGMGSGLVTGFLARLEARRILATDINPEVLPVAENNLRRSVAETDIEQVELYARSLLDGIRQNCRAPYEVVVACIPQVKLPANRQLFDGHNTGDYYDEVEIAGLNGQVRKWNQLGLGLNAALLIQAWDFLPPGGEIILNLGGRPSQAKLKEMMLEFGFEPEIVHHQIVQQDTGTNIGSLANDEKSGGNVFEFFHDPDGQEPINGAEAHVLNQQKQPVYHAIYVIRGRKTTKPELNQGAQNEI